jgi:hypothetical protein
MKSGRSRTPERHTALRMQEADRAVSQDRVYGHTRSGDPITDREIEALAVEAEAGYDVGTLLLRRAKRGRPALGLAPASVESVRPDPRLATADAPVATTRRNPR